MPHAHTVTVLWRRSNDKRILISYIALPNPHVSCRAYAPHNTREFHAPGQERPSNLDGYFWGCAQEG